MPRWWKSGNTYMYSKTGEGGRQGRGKSERGKEGVASSNPRRTGNLQPQPDPYPSQKWPGNHIFFFRPPHPKSRAVLTFRKEVGAGSSSRAGRTAAASGRRSERPSVRDREPDGWERGGAGGGAGWGRPLLPSPRGLHRCPAEESRPGDGLTVGGTAGTGRGELKGRDRARAGRETARSGPGSSPCRGGLGAEAGRGEVAVAGEMREEGAPGGVQPASHG